MANLKSLKNRIKSVKSTQKITKAMKMVAASKLRRARERAEAAAPYSDRMRRMVQTLASSVTDIDAAPALLAGRAVEKTHLFLVISSDRGLCGSLNVSVTRAVKRKIAELEREGKAVKLVCVGRKGYELMKRTHAAHIIEKIEGLSRRNPTYSDAEQLAARVIQWFESGQADSCTVFYNQFKSAISQVANRLQLIPLDREALVETKTAGASGVDASYEYEPGEEEILDTLLPRNVAVQLYHALLENAASEQGARMTAMENATRNAGEMIGRLTLVYNRTRQAAITKELIEIISGAEAV